MTQILQYADCYALKISQLIHVSCLIFLLLLPLILLLLSLLPGDYEAFSRETVRPIQRSFLAHKELRATQETMLRTAESSLCESDHNNSSSGSGNTKNRKESAALQRFHQAIEVSATGLNLLRSLHKQVSV